MSDHDKAEEFFKGVNFDEYKTYRGFSESMIKELKDIMNKSMASLEFPNIDKAITTKLQESIKIVEPMKKIYHVLNY